MREMFKRLRMLLLREEQKQEKVSFSIEELERRVAPTTNSQVGWGC
jgi:hypothetical protein